MLALLAKVQKAFIFGRLLQARVDNHSRNLGMKLLQDQGFPADWPRVPPNNPWVQEAKFMITMPTTKMTLQKKQQQF